MMLPHPPWKAPSRQRLRSPSALMRGTANKQRGGQGPGSARLQHAAVVQLISLLTIQLSSRCRRIYRHNWRRTPRRLKKSPQVLPMKLEFFCSVLFKSAAIKKK